MRRKLKEEAQANIGNTHVEPGTPRRRKSDEENIVTGNAVVDVREEAVREAGR